MNRHGKFILSLTLGVLLFIASGFFVHQSIVSWRWNKAVSAVGSLPYQIGLTGVTISQCTPSCCFPACTCCIGTGPGAGGALCSFKDVARCTMYAGVSGTPAGGMGGMALFLNTAIGQAGLSSGGQLIAGGMTMTEMDSGVLASAGGCSGCTAKSGMVNKFFVWLDKLDNYIIAGFRKSQK